MKCCQLKGGAIAGLLSWPLYGSGRDFLAIFDRPHMPPNGKLFHIWASLNELALQIWEKKHFPSLTLISEKQINDIKAHKESLT